MHAYPDPSVTPVTALTNALAHAMEPHPTHTARRSNAPDAEPAAGEATAEAPEAADFEPLSERQIRAMVRADLPASAFRRRPWRALCALLLVGLIAASTVVVLALPLRWYAALFMSLVIGNLYACLMFLAHEVAHGAVVGSRRIQDLIVYPACAIFCLSPHLWRQWHNAVHHPHANVPGRDPDQYGTLQEREANGRVHSIVLKFAPGSRHWLSAFYLFAFFTLQVQAVLWHDSRHLEGFRRMSRKRAVFESMAMLGLWVLFGVLVGWWAALWVIVIPMLVANCVVMSYIVTNHMLRPLSEEVDTLGGTMSVTTWKVLDWAHFNFSHHVEHHLFPSMPSSQYPLVRKSLKKLVGDRYLAPSHWWALAVLYGTPRVYDGLTTLVEPTTGRRVALASVEDLLSTQ